MKFLSLTVSRAPLTIVALFVALWPATAIAAPPGDDDDDTPRTGPVEEVVVTAQRLDTARAAVEPSLGASTYTISNETIENRPGGETTNLNQVLLQVPGVSQGGAGQLRIRGSNGELQYRINNVLLPSGLTDLGETLSARMAENIQLVTGALPAQYGLSVAGVVNITTKSGVYYDGGQAELYGGNHGVFEPALEYAGSVNSTNVFVTGSYLQNDVGLASPDGSADPLHDHTEQLEGLAYVDRALTANSRLSLVAGGSNEYFQISNQRGLNALTDTTIFGFVRPLDANGVTNFPSEQLNERQRETNGFGILSYLWTDNDATVQASIFARASSFVFKPDNTGDLLFYGVGQTVTQHDLAFGLQLEGVFEFNPSHTVRAGLVTNTDRSKMLVQSLALPVDALGRQLTNSPSLLTTASPETEQQTSVYVQDEWRPFDSLTINAGLRFDRVNTPASTSQLSPRVSLVWTPTKETIVHVGYARYFVPPPLDNSSAMVTQLAGTTGMQPSTTGNPLRAETDNYFNAGVQRTVGGLVLGVDGYWREATNLIDSGFFGGLPTQKSFNYRAGRIRGLEFSATYADGPVSAWSNLAISKAEGSEIVSNQFYFTAAELAFVSSHLVGLQHGQTVTVSAGTSYHWGDLLFSGDLLYGSGQRDMASRFGLASTYLPDHLQINLAGVYHVTSIGGRPLDLRLDLVNVLNSKYEIQDGHGPGGSQPQWGSRRGIFVGIEQSF